MYFVIGGAVAKRHVLQLYQNKAAYEDIVERPRGTRPSARAEEGPFPRGRRLPRRAPRRTPPQVVRMFQGQPLTGFKYKAYALTGAFKCSAVQAKVYKGSGRRGVFRPWELSCLALGARRGSRGLEERSPRRASRKTRPQAATRPSSSSACGTPTRAPRP